MRLAGMLSTATAAVAAVVLTAAFALPAIAQSPPDPVVYFPLGNGATYSCAGGPPFVVKNNHHSGGSSPGNCAIEQIGPPPVGLVCDIPTTITFEHEMRPWTTTDAWLCLTQYGGQMQYGTGAQAGPSATGGAPARLAQTGGPPLVPLAAGGAATAVLLLGGALVLTTTRRRRRRRRR